MKKKAKLDDLESFLAEEGMLEEVQRRVKKSVRAMEENLDLLVLKQKLTGDLHNAMRRQNVTPAELARRMGTSRTVVYRLLDNSDIGVTLETLGKVSKALGLELHLAVRAPRASKAAAPQRKLPAAARMGKAKKVGR